MFQKEDTSSIENKRPPTGAPNAEATPAAAPAEIKLRLKECFFNVISSENNEDHRLSITFPHKMRYKISL